MNSLLNRSIFLIHNLHFIFSVRREIYFFLKDFYIQIGSSCMLLYFSFFSIIIFNTQTNQRFGAIANEQAAPLASPNTREKITIVAANSCS